MNRPTLRLLVVVGACGALIASLGDPPQIILAHLYPQFAESAAPALAQRPHSLSRSRHVLFTSILNLRSPRRRRSRSARIRSAEVAMFCPSVASMVHEKPVCKI
jgi:hypothetical protein